MSPQRQSTTQRVIGVVGELLITVGIVLLLYVAYQLWWTNVLAERAAQSDRIELKTEWEASGSPDKAPTVVVKPGKPFGLIYIPRLKEKVWGMPLVEGVEKAELAQGIGHYPKTALPGQIGNFAVAGHRSTNGEPLAQIDKIKAGDLAIVETAVGYYAYELTKTKLVQPEDTWVIDPVPGKKDVAPTERLITITTCHPRWGNAQRWIWWGTLKKTYVKAEGQAPLELLE